MLFRNLVKKLQNKHKKCIIYQKALIQKFNMCIQNRHPQIHKDILCRKPGFVRKSDSDLMSIHNKLKAKNSPCSALILNL